MSFWWLGFIAVVDWLSASSVFGASQVLALNLKDCESRSLQNSERVQQTELELSAQQFKVDSTRSNLWPRLSFDASYRYLSVVPSIAQPKGAALALGDNHNYSIGPVLNWMVFDFGATQSAAQAQQVLFNAKNEELRNARRQSLLGVRLAFYRVSSALEQQALVTDSLKLAQSQYRDIKNRSQAGSSSRIDLLASHREVLSLEGTFREVQTELSNAALDLLRQTNDSRTEFDFSRPLRSSLVHGLPDNLATPSVLIEAQKPSELSQLVTEAEVKVANHPGVVAMKLQAESLELMSNSIHSGLYPKVQVQLKSSFDYPNGPALERVQQNTVSVGLSVPLFEFSRSRNEASEKSQLALALQTRTQSLEKDYERDLEKVRIQLRTLESQKETLSTLSEEATQLASLIYSAYQNGRSSFLEVQSANLRVLDARVQLARNQVQILVSRAQLQSLVNEK